MASITERNGHFYVVYWYKDSSGRRKQKWEKYDSMAKAKMRKTEVDYKKMTRTLTVPECKTMKDLLIEYVELYGKNTWAVSTYSSNAGLIRNYIEPLIGKEKVENVNTRFLERYYQILLQTPAVQNKYHPREPGTMVSTKTVRDVHKLLRSCFHQAVKWGIMEKNPATTASVPKHKMEKRNIWDAETMMAAIDLCKDERLKLALHLAFSCSLRIGELLALTWDCVDISDEAIEHGTTSIYVNKEITRTSKVTLEALGRKDIITVFPEEGRNCTTVRVMKSPKTESSVRRVYLPKSVALMLVEWKKGQEELISMLGGEYQNYNLVMATAYGLPISASLLRNGLDKLSKENNLPKIVFHSIRHTSITYKLKLNGGDVKAVQGDSGHAQVKMVTDVYSHILDEDRKHNAELFEQSFYNNEEPSPTVPTKKNTITLPDGVDPNLAASLLSNQNILELLQKLVKSNV